MRIDKYLWAVRLFKSRNAASIACKKGYVQIASQNVKPSREIYVSDKISVRKNQLVKQLYVLDLPKSRVGAKLVSQYCKDTTDEETIALHKAVSENQRLSRVSGTGRPSKKDRRDLEDFLEEDT
ncbi:MAG: Heat shock protein 15 [Bacteroidota bacterium]|nr:MAG: Heat shock protein 15 [Bacteroidota bacterium]